jgi:hypothetical protein
MTCRWPGCDKPVEKSDVDHTVPYPFGPTHPSNTKHYCRMQLREITLRVWIVTGFMPQSHRSGAASLT